MSILSEWGKAARHWCIDNDNMSQRDLAKTLGVSPQMLSKVERGHAQVPVSWIDRVPDDLLEGTKRILVARHTSIIEDVQKRAARRCSKGVVDTRITRNGAI